MTISETECLVCSQWTKADRRALRRLIDTIPLADPICRACNAAFWRNVIVPMLPCKPPTKH
jgi:hypothetical protein